MDMKWAEPLPEQCPPKGAFPPDDVIYYRLVESNPPTERDFFSLRKLNPDKRFNADECTARAVSVFCNLASCANIRLLPTHREKNEHVLEFRLTSKSGVVMQTGRQQHHYSWWRANGYLPVPCRVVA